MAGYKTVSSYSLYYTGQTAKLHESQQLRKHACKCAVHTDETFACKCFQSLLLSLFIVLTRQGINLFHLIIFIPDNSTFYLEL